MAGVLATYSCVVKTASHGCSSDFNTRPTNGPIT